MPKLISHRGNLTGPDISAENVPEQIDIVLKEGYDVEVDIFLQKQKYYLGHNEPQYLIDIQWLVKRKNKIWLHCKNIYALESFLGTNFNYFWHQQDDFTLTSKNFIWTYPNKLLTGKSICVLPEQGFKGDINNCAGVCTDFILNKTWNHNLK
jgi:hypothetical protein